MFLRIDEPKTPPAPDQAPHDLAPHGLAPHDQDQPPTQIETPPPITLARLIPNAVTTLALCSGLAALHFALAERWDKALLAIVASAIFDVLDGGAARLLKSQSRFGAVLDSLSDFLAFGVVPAVIIHERLLEAPTTKLVDAFGLMAVLAYAVCAALRLARFTAAALPPSPPDPHTKPAAHFTGVPTPAAAGCALLPVFLQYTERFEGLIPRLPEWAIASYVLGIALLMVSRLPTFSLKALRIPRRLVALVLVVLALIFAQFIADPWLTMAGLIALYLLSLLWAGVRVLLPGTRARAMP